MLIKFNKFLKLNESPDNIYFNGKTLSRFDDDAISFSMLNDDKTLYVHDTPGEDHSDIEYVPYDSNDKTPIKNNMFKWKTFYGRLWLNHKIISFWNVPKIKKESNAINISFNDHKYETDIKKFRYYMKDLQKKLIKRGLIDKNEDLNEWYMEIDHKYNKFIKIKDFFGNFKPDEEEYKYHLMKMTDPRRKNRSKKYFGKIDDSRPIKWKQALLRSESINKFSIFPDDYVIIKAPDYLKDESDKNGNIIVRVFSRTYDNGKIVLYGDKIPYDKNNWTIKFNETDVIDKLSEEDKLIYKNIEKYNL